MADTGLNDEVSVRDGAHQALFLCAIAEDVSVAPDDQRPRNDLAQPIGVIVVEQGTQDTSPHGGRKAQSLCDRSIDERAIDRSAERRHLEGPREGRIHGIAEVRDLIAPERFLQAARRPETALLRRTRSLAVGCASSVSAPGRKLSALLMIMLQFSVCLVPLLGAGTVEPRGDSVKSALNRECSPRSGSHSFVITMSRTKNNASPATAPAWELQVLGGLVLRSASGAVVELPTRKSALLLAYLATPAGTAHPRDRLADLLWPSSGQDQARGSLRHALAALRKLLGSDAIEGARDMIKLQPGIVAVDLDDVADLAESRVAPSFSRAPATGTFLDGIETESEALGEWLTFERTRSRALQQAALQRTVHALSSADRHAEAIAAAERLVALDPLREQSHRTLMQALFRAGERSKALAQFKRLQEVLKSELGIAPSPQSNALADEIRQSALPALSPMNAANMVGPSCPPHAANGRSAGHMTIAVLPFHCLGDDGALADYADGFSSELVTGLSRAHEFSVISWQSSAQVSGRVGDAAQSAADLNAGYGLTGTLRLVDGRMRIGAQLVAVASRIWIWAERFELEMSEAVTAQDGIIAGIMGAVDAGVRRFEREAARSRPIADLDAWTLYHRGMWHMYRFTRDNVDAAEGLFATAIEKEPSAAGPYAGLAYASIVRVLWRFSDDPRTTLGEGLRHARNALVRDEHDANVHTVLGRLLVMAGQLQRGIEHLERAIELNPSHAHAHYGLGHALYVAGNPIEALLPLATALRLSPKDPLASMFLTMSAFCHLMLDDLSAAEAAARRARNLLSMETWSRLALAATLQIKGEVSEARTAIAEAREIEPSLTMSTFAPLVQHIPPAMRDRVLAALTMAGLPSN